MSRSPLSQVFRHIRSLSVTSEPSALTDEELLCRFVRRHDQEAFAVLVARHGPMVLSVCRRVLGHAHDAEDAFQATFLVLARKAASLREGGKLVNWLHGVAYRMARYARRTIVRRRAHEAKVPTPPPPVPAWQAAWNEVQAVLHEEIERLPQLLRGPFLLCYLEGRSGAEAARQLGLKEGTIWSRLAKARQLLRERLARRGVELGALIATTVLAADRRAVPVPLATSTAGAAAAFLAGDMPDTVLSARAVVWAEGGAKMLSATRLSMLLVLSTALLSAGAGVWACWDRTAAMPAAPDQVAEQPKAPADRHDRYGDTLPEGALARLGTLRFRPRGGSPWPGNRCSPGIGFLPGDKTLMTLAWGKLDFWDVATGKEAPRWTAPPWAFVNTLSPDGKILAAETKGSAAHLWEAVTGKELHQLTGRDGWFHDAAFSADGRMLVAAMHVAPHEGEPKRPWWAVWETATGKVLRAFEEKGILAVAISPDGKMVAAADWFSTSTVYLYETASGRKLHTFGPQGLTNKLVFAPDGKTIAAVESGDNKSMVHLWDVARGTLRVRLKTADSVSSVAVSPDGKTVATAHRESFHVWDVSTGEWAERFEGKGCPTADLAFSSDGKILATSGNSVVRLWEVASGKEILPTGEGHQGEVEALAFRADGKTLVTFGSDHTIRDWDAATGKEIRRFSVSGRADGDGSFAVEGRALALCVDKEVRLHDAATGKELHRFVYPAFVRHAALTPDGTTLAVFTGDEDKTVRLVDVGTGKERWAQPYPQFIQVMAFSPDGAVLAVGLVCDQQTLREGSARLLDTATGRELHRLHLSDNATNFAFTPDGKTLATPDMGDVLRLWEVASGKERAQLPVPFRSEMAFSPDGRVLVLSDREGTLHLCRTATGQELQRLRGHRSELTCLAFAADAKKLASGSWDTTALVWDVSRLLERNEEPRGERDIRPPEALWTDLASLDATKAYRAIQELVAAPRQSVPLIQARLHPALPVEPEKITALLAALDNDDFTTREKATADLEKLGEPVEPALRQTLEGKPSLEVRRRAGTLLQNLRMGSLGPERLRELRSLEVAEQVGDAEARQLLKALAQGAPTARLTREAKASLERLERSRASSIKAR
jgi:RNA polymerase sigma factor (sigma-70 family)